MLAAGIAMAPIFQMIHQKEEENNIKDAIVAKANMILSSIPLPLYNCVAIQHLLLCK